MDPRKVICLKFPTMKWNIDYLILHMTADVTVGFEHANYTVTEGKPVRVCFNSTITGTLTSPLLVTVSTLNGSAVGKT